MADRTVYGTVTFPFAAYVDTDSDNITVDQLLVLLDTYERGFVDRIVSDDEYRVTAHTDKGRVVISSVADGHADY